MQQDCTYHTTHIAQNYVYNQDIMMDWVTDIGREITCNQYLGDVIVDMYETNVDYDMPSRQRSRDGECKEFRFKWEGNSYLGSHSKWQKVYSIVDFQRCPWSRITHEFNNPAYDYHQQLHYTVQRKTWNDIPRMHKWINAMWITIFREAGRPTYSNLPLKCAFLKCALPVKCSTCWLKLCVQLYKRK